VQPSSDEQLMLSFRAGDARAFAQLVNRHRAPVFQFVFRFVGNTQRAEDVVQETWLKVVRSSADYQPKAKFTTWLYTIARNLCVDLARKENPRRHDASLDAPIGDDAEGPTRGEVLADGDASPERTAHNRLLQPLLVRALKALPEEQREVFILREYQGIGFKEIAEIVGINENTVKSRMRYALESLRKQLAEAGVDGGEMASETGRTVA
jgi:RNA polymerase sigma-70 factor, ECF subfamily